MGNILYVISKKVLLSLNIFMNIHLLCLNLVKNESLYCIKKTARGELFLFIFNK